MRAGIAIISIFAAGLLGVLWLRHESSQSLASVEAPPHSSSEHMQEAAAQSEVGSLEAVKSESGGPLVSTSSRAASGSSVDPSSRASVPAIDVTPGFEAYLAETATGADSGVGALLAQQHKQLNKQPRDEAWADRMEREMREYVQNRLIQQKLDPQRIELSVIDCRTAGCEVQAIGRPEDSGNPQRDFQFFVRGMTEGPLYSELDSKSAMTLSFSLPDGRVGYLTFLERKH